MDLKLYANLVKLLRETAQAHHDAFAATGGEDPDWAIWYADYLQGPLARKTNMKLSKSQLIYCLMDADSDHRARSPESDWPEYYADRIMERCAPCETPADDTLALYHFDSCPFCRTVRANIDSLGIEVELRDIFENPQHREALVNARGRATVPVLRITSPNGEERWMPESQDIVRYLKATFH